MAPLERNALAKTVRATSFIRIKYRITAKARQEKNILSDITGIDVV
jgi:hypothetical protein